MMLAIRGKVIPRFLFAWLRRKMLLSKNSFFISHPSPPSGSLLETTAWIGSFRIYWNWLLITKLKTKLSRYRKICQPWTKWINFVSFPFQFQCDSQKGDIIDTHSSIFASIFRLNKWADKLTLTLIPGGHFLRFSISFPILEIKNN